MTNAIYAFSGDPITYGHIDIIKRASNVFDNVIVALGKNPDKNYLFSLEERKRMVKNSIKNIPNIKIDSFNGLLVDYAYEKGINIIIKGIRNNSDFDYETMLHEIGCSQKLGIDTHVLFANPKLAHISSTAVKVLQKEQGLIHEYVPIYVKQCLEEKISNQYILGITGEIGSGKSYISQKFVDLGQRKGLEVYNIDLDKIGHKIVGSLMQPKYNEVRKQIADTFGQEVRKTDGTIDRKLLGNIVFTDSGALDKLNEIMKNPLLVRLRRELYGKKGLILFNAAIIAEVNLSYVCNNNVVLVYADKKTQQQRLVSRGVNFNQIQSRLNSQYNYQEKKSVLEKSIEKYDYGNIFELDNSIGKDNMKFVFKNIMNYFNIK